MTDVCLPAGWARATLGDIGEYYNGRGFKKEEWSTAGRPIIRIQNLTSLGKPFNYYDGEVDPKHEIRAGDLLLSWAATLDVFRWSGPDAVLNQHIFKVESWIDPAFHYLVLKHVLADLRRQSHGSGIVHITRDRFLSATVPLPPIDEQRRIVDAVERLGGLVDRAAGHLHRANRRSGAMRAGILGTFDVESDVHARLDEVGEVSLGATPSRKEPSYWNGDIPWVSSGEVTFCRINDTKEQITETGLGNRDRRLQPPGTVLLAMYGEGRTRGQAAILDTWAAHNQAVAAIRLHANIMLPEFLYFCLMAQYESIREIGHGGQQKNLSGALVRAIKVPCPSLNEQGQLVAEVERRLVAVDRLRQTLDFGARESEILGRGVLAQALNGSLTNRHDTDEPAHALLERLTARRARFTRSKKGRAALVRS